ncbi:MAG TPA: hypothetical protein VFW38_05615 [Solirubrobacteraceae bacterium]|nr:hypothetical protein [Solirubrobacteraceae bacterium]
MSVEKSLRATAAAFAAVAALCLTSLLPTACVAAPRVKLVVTPRPIPGFAATGDRLGAGAEVETKVTITGDEYDAAPSPLVGIEFAAPAGVAIDPAGFASCSIAALEESGVTACPRRSLAGPPGEGLGIVSFGGSRVYEKVKINSVFAASGGLTFFVEGDSPAFFQIPEKSHWLMAAPPYGPELVIEVPLVETLPGAPDASVLSFKVTIGAAYRRHGRTVSYLTLPPRCPRGGAPLRMQLKFLSGETTTVGFKQPCPKR